MTIDSAQLREILPQSYPFLMIDRVTECEKGKSLTAIKNITVDEWNSEGCSFPETLILEAASQAALVLYHISKNKDGEHPQYFLGRMSADFLKPVVTGDQLQIKASAKMLEMGGYSDIEISVNGQTVTNLEIVYSVKR